MKRAYLLIAIMIFGIGLAFAQTPPSIDSVWFWEETDCNDSNIVHICYILSDAEGDPATISAQMSADSGATWTVPLTTLLNDTDDLGDSILPGTHCFDWIMSEDYAGVETTEAMLRVSVNTAGKEFFVFVGSPTLIYKEEWNFPVFGDPIPIISTSDTIFRTTRSTTSTMPPVSPCCSRGNVTCWWSWDGDRSSALKH